MKQTKQQTKSKFTRHFFGISHVSSFAFDFTSHSGYRLILFNCQNYHFPQNLLEKHNHFIQNSFTIHTHTQTHSQTHTRLHKETHCYTFIHSTHHFAFSPYFSIILYQNQKYTFKVELIHPLSWSNSKIIMLLHRFIVVPQAPAATVPTSEHANGKSAAPAPPPTSLPGSIQDYKGLAALLWTFYEHSISFRCC